MLVPDRGYPPHRASTMSFFASHYKNTQLEDVFDDSPVKIHMAQYSQALARYKTVFGDKLHIIWYDDIISEPLVVLKKTVYKN